MKHIKNLVFTLLAIVFFPSFVQAAEDSDETVAETAQLEEGVDSGIITQNSPIIGYQPLTVAGQEIEATYMEETLGERHGAIILLHDQGGSLEDQGVITPLRHRMPEYGWSTLTVALDYPFEPAIFMSTSLAGDENASEASPAEPAEKEENTEASEQDKAELPAISNRQRVEAAIAFLQAKQIDRIIFLGYGAGGDLAVEILDTETVPINALILVSTPALTKHDVFSTMQQPILDLYGDNDLAGVAEAVQQRKVTMKRTGNSRYTAREVIGADHSFTGLQTELANSLRGWLKVIFIDEKKN